MPTACSIRPATADDADIITEFNYRLAFETEGRELDRDILQAGVVRGLQRGDEARYFLAELNGTVVGQLMITREWSDWRNGWTVWLQSVYVHADHRCLLYTSPSPRDRQKSRMPSSA